MKKSLIALSVLAATTSIAQAQNVTLYGIMDLSVSAVDNGAFSNTALLPSAHTSSRLGIRGSEDLGGGLRANFMAEAGLNPDTGYLGTTPTTTVAASNRIFGRQISVGLSGGFGAIDMGSLPSSANAFQFGYAAGIGGNYDVVSARDNVFGAFARAWKDNSVRYTSPNMNGFTATVMYTLGNTTTLQGAARDLPAGSGSEGQTDATKKMGAGTDVRINWVGGPLSAAVFQAQNQTQASNSAQETAKGAGVAYQVNSQLRAGLSYVSFDPTDAAIQDQNKAQSAAVSYQLSPALTVGGTFANVTNENAAGDRKARFTSASAHYALSKRTTAYGYYIKVTNNSASTMGLGGIGQGATGFLAPMGAAAAGQDNSAMGVGLRHSF